MIGGLKVFSEPYALTGGGPGSASQVIALEVFEKFGRGEWGLGTASECCPDGVCHPYLHSAATENAKE